MTKKLPFKNQYLLAPMEKVNDIAFRILCKKAGAGATFTGMYHPLTKQKIDLQDKPVLQLFSDSDKGIEEFIKKYDKKVSAWDFNLGCPAKIAQKNKVGGYLTDLKKINKIIKTIRNSTKKPIGLKIRKSKIAFDILKIAEKYCDFICIHPRTKEQGYSGIPDTKFAEKIKKSTFLPVIYSGDVNEKNADKLLEKFDYVNIGREAIGHPEIFAQLTNTKYKKTFKDYLVLAQKYKIKFNQIKFQAMNFAKKNTKATKIRQEIIKCNNLNELKKLINPLTKSIYIPQIKI